MAHQHFLNTHYNLLDALLLANTALVAEVAELVVANYDLLNSADAMQHFDAWWELHGHHWHLTDRAAIYTIWEVVWWAKTQPMDSGHRMWWDAVKVRIAA